MTYGAVIRRYLFLGLAAGILGALYLRILAEPTIKQGLKFEAAYDAAHTPAGQVGQGITLYSRPAQLIGGMIGMLLAALLVSLIFGTLYAVLRHRIVAYLGDVKASTGLAGLALVFSALVPWLKYPFLPPGMGDGATVFKRSAWDLALIVVCIVAFVLVEWLVAKLKGRIDSDAWWTLAIVAPIAVLVVIMLLFPNVGDKYPYGYSVPLVWRFRLLSLGWYCIMWLGILGIGGGWLMKRLATKSSLEPVRLPLADQRLEMSAQS